jgi:acyl-CoA dehydrogenase family member 9
MGTEMTDGSYLKRLFQGEIEETEVFPYPKLAETETDTLHHLLANIRRYFDQHVDSWAIDHSARIPPAVLRGLGELGLFGLAIPQQFGGGSLSQTAYARVIQELAGLDSSIAVTVASHQSLGVRGLVLFGSELQKRAYLPRAASGALLCAFALTEPGTGSDVSAIQTRAELHGDHYVLNGTKVWISNGGIADLFTVFARTSPAVNGAKPRITAFLVERGPGVTSGPNESKLGIRGTSTTEVTFDDVRVPIGNVLHEAGNGFNVAVEVLNDGRLSLASGCVGMAKRLIQLASERASNRRAFGRSISEFGLIKDKIADMMSETYALECMTYLTTGLVDRGVADYAIESAICKVFGSESLWRTVNDALQIAAGTGYMAAFPYERLLRDARVNLIFEGTNEVLRSFIALTGMQAPGRFPSTAGRTARNPRKGLALLSDLAKRTTTAARDRQRCTRAHPQLSREAEALQRYTQLLSLHATAAVHRHGRSLVEMQFTQKRIADIAIDTYAITAVLSRTTRALEAHGVEGARRELELAQIFVRAAEHRLSHNTAQFGTNDDELRKNVASKTYTDGGYPLDIL